MILRKYKEFPWCYQVVPDLEFYYQLSRLYRLIKNYVASDLLLDSFFIKRQSLALREESGDITTPEPVSVGKCTTSHGKIVKFP